MRIAMSILILFICFTCVTYSQVQDSEFYDANEAFKQLFSHVKMNSAGNLCVTMKNEGGKYLTYIEDNKEPIISVDNEIYCVKDSIKFFERHSSFNLKKINSNYWSISYKPPNPHMGTAKKMEGGFEIKNNNIKSLKKEEYELLINKDEN